MAKSFKKLVRKTGNKKTQSIAKKRTAELLNKLNKLQYDEQYGYWSYYVNDEPICDLSEVEINGTKYKVVSLDNTEVNYEMGRHDIVNCSKYYISVPFEGTKVLVDLTELLDRKTPDWMKGEKKRRAKAKVVATNFSIEKPNPAPAAAKRRIR